MAKKIKKSQVLRHVIQVILFLTLPGLYAMTFSEVRTVYKMIIEGNFNFLQAFPSLIEFTVAMLLTIVMGRWFCGWLCAFGAYNDLIYFISKKVFKSKFRVNEKVDSILKYAKYVILVFIIIISWTMGSSILESTSPWDAFGQITDISTIFSSLLIGLILLILITIGAAFIERFFCRYLCPLGAIFAIISRIGIVKINKPKADCGRCRACTMNCSMGLNLYKVDGARGGDCINCLKCTEVCPRNNANINILGQDVNQNLAGSLAMATMVGVYGLSNFGADALTNSGIISNQTEISSSAVLNSTSEYKDGTYTGSGIGFKGGTTKISVTIADGKITKIETLSYEDNRPYYEKAESSLTKNIISKQSTSVDTVSGATFSSKGIISAVKDALSQATNSSNDTTSSQGAYKDGTYTGSGIGFKGRTTKISVTVASGKINKIETLSYGDDRQYYEKAEDSVTKSIISKQSTSVDTVSGATFSSKGIISAVNDALNQATNSSNNDTISSGNKDEASTTNTTEASKNGVESSKANESSSTTAIGSGSSNSGTTTSNNKTVDSSNTQPTTSKASTSSSQTSSSQGAYKDGTYTGSGKGFKGGTTTVSVTVANGKISSIETLSNGDTPQYYNRASGSVIKNIISKQSTSVDTVSGATYSSKGIMSAVTNALSQAK